MAHVRATTRAFATLDTLARNVKFPFATICLQRIPVFVQTETEHVPSTITVPAHHYMPVSIVKSPFVIPFWQRMLQFVRPMEHVARAICALARMVSMAPIVKIIIAMALRTIVLLFVPPTDIALLQAPVLVMSDILA